jgi:hypothetical protein
MDLISLALDIGLGLCAFRLAWSVDRTQKEMLKTQVEMAKTQAQQTEILQELILRVNRLETR